LIKDENQGLNALKVAEKQAKYSKDK
jgi:hypothetical protein